MMMLINVCYVLVERPPFWYWRTVFITVWHHLTTVTVAQGDVGPTC